MTVAVAGLLLLFVGSCFLALSGLGEPSVEIDGVLVGCGESSEVVELSDADRYIAATQCVGAREDHDTAESVARVGVGVGTAALLGVLAVAYVKRPI